MGRHFPAADGRDVKSTAGDPVAIVASANSDMIGMAERLHAAVSADYRWIFKGLRSVLVHRHEDDGMPARPKR